MARAKECEDETDCGTDLELSQDNLQRKNDELAQAYKDKSRKLLQAQELYDRVKKKAEMSQMQQAASDAIDMTIQAAPERFPPNPMRNLSMAVAPLAPASRVGHANIFDASSVSAALPRLNAQPFPKENTFLPKALQPLGKPILVLGKRSLKKDKGLIA